MALSNNITRKLTNKQLSIQIGLNGLSFSVLDSTNTIEALKQFDFDRKLTPLELLDRITDLFQQEEELQYNFTNVTVIHDNELSTLVPKPLFNEEALADYLKFNSKILKTDYICYDESALGDSICVYVPYVNINNYIYDKFGSFTFKHVSTILIESILQLEKNSETVKMYVNVNKTHFELIALDKSQLLFYNSFEYVTKEDFIYYLLFTAEQLKLNPEIFELVFIGDIEKSNDLYKIAYKYIRNVAFGSRKDIYNYKTSIKTDFSNFSLIKSF